MIRILKAINLATFATALIVTNAGAAVIVTPVGSPLFVAADFHLFAAPIGTAASGYAEFSETQQLILPPPNHLPNPTLSIGPGAAHAGPYDHEMADGVAANGYIEGTTFTTEQYSNGSGVYFVFMLLPSTGSPAGSSPDFASGPILANAVFPLTISGVTFTNGTLNDTLARNLRCLPSIWYPGSKDSTGTATSRSSSPTTSISRVGQSRAATSTAFQFLMGQATATTLWRASMSSLSPSPRLGC